MKNVFYKIIKIINPDLFELLTVDINSQVNVKGSQNEIYLNRGNYSELVGMQRGTNFIKRIFPIRKFDGLTYEPKIKFKKQIFSVNKQSF